mmetsp:Transcript_2119/g.3966  ORF Transcript_2119/g.3966 Transcript_2119/m.3966 type:complete len:118 (+) Transcript_2119:731-1084(+)
MVVFKHGIVVVSESQFIMRPNEKAVVDTSMAQIVTQGSNEQTKSIDSTQCAENVTRRDLEESELEGSESMVKIVEWTVIVSIFYCHRPVLQAIHWHVTAVHAAGVEQDDENHSDQLF